MPALHSLSDCLDRLGHNFRLYLPNLPAVGTHEQSAIREKTKMMLEMALIYSVIPRRNRAQISSGSVLSRPMRKS